LKKNFYLKNISIFCTTLLSQRPMFDSQPETNCFSTNCVPDLDICEERIKEAVQTKRKLHYWSDVITLVSSYRRGELSLNWTWILWTSGMPSNDARNSPTQHGNHQPTR